MTKFYYLLFVSLFYISACKTAGKAYNKGDYENAIELAIKKLQKDPADGETKTLLQNVYRFAVNENEEAIRTLSSSTNELKYEQICAVYNRLQNLHIKLKQNRSLFTFINPTDYSTYLETYREKAADVYIQKGMAFMQEGSKEDFRNAYQSFKNALRYKKEDADLRNKMREAYELGLVNIIVLPLDEYANNGYRYSASNGLRNFENEVIRNLQYGTGNEFVKFHSDWEARSKNITPDEVVELRLGRMEIGRPYDQTGTHTSTKEVVIKETVYKPDSVVKEYAKISAQVSVTRRTLVSDGELYITVRTPAGRILWNDQARGEHRWQVEFATYRGDERALTNNDRAMLNNQTNYNAPREDVILEAILKQLQNDLNYRIKNYYSRYY